MNLLLCDLETTGLDPTKGQILEVYAAKLSALPRPGIQSEYHAIAHVKKDDYPIDPVVEKMHTGNGLWVECARSSLTQEQVLEGLEEYLWTKTHEKWVMVGDSVHFDRGWLLAKRPSLPLSHRVVDVSGFSRVLKSVRPLVSDRRAGASLSHRADSDARGSLRHLRDMLEGLK